ncbi:hypothetical protein ACFLYE_01195 [Chloroflexota bacterium]
MAKGRPTKIFGKVEETLIGIILSDTQQEWTPKRIGELSEDRRLRNAICKSLRAEHPEWNEKQLYAKYLAMRPGGSAIQKWYTKEKTKFAPGPLDTPWTIGACEKYNISGDMIPRLLELKRIEASRPVDIRELEKEFPCFSLTIRVARWFSRLYSLVDKLMDAQQPEAPELLRLGSHYIIAEQYAEAERLSEVKGKDCPDTSELDITTQELNIMEGFFNTFCPESQKKARQALDNFTPLPQEWLESVLGKLTKEQADLFNEWLHICCIVQVHPRQGSQSQKKLFKEHPELIPLTETWLKWCIESQGKDGEA